MKLVSTSVNKAIRQEELEKVFIDMLEDIYIPPAEIELMKDEARELLQAIKGYENSLESPVECILMSSLPNRSLTCAKSEFLAKASKIQDYCQNCDFEEDNFNGVYANLGIHSVFAKPYNARAKVIERFFLEFQEEFEKMMPSYIGTSIEDKPVWLKRGEKLHKQIHQKTTKNYIPMIPLGK